jgi:hypothetical protein
MPEQQSTTKWLARWRGKRHRTLMDKLFGGVDGDSEEKSVQRHTSRGKELEAEDRARVIKGSTGGG